MAEEKPSPVTYHEFNIPTLNGVFAWSAVILLAVSGWMIWADYSREWKGYQRRFVATDIARTRQQLAAAASSGDQKKLADVQARLQAAETAEASRKSEHDDARKSLDGLLGRWYSADQRFRFIKAELDVARYEFDEAKLKNHDVAAREKKFREVQEETEKRRLVFEKIDAEKQALEAKLAALDKDAETARKDLAKLNEGKTRLEVRLKSLHPSLITDALRDAPLLDFLAPSIKVKQVILPQLHEDVNFMTVPRVDRCQSCHLAIDKPGYTDEKLPPVFRTHPRLQELLGRNHPVERIGCTGCHAGSGRSITFIDATHTPRDEAQKKAWEKKYHWRRVEHWDFPMLPLALTEANCVNCHKQETRIPGAERYNAGRQMIEDNGCFGCHKIDLPGFDELRKIGPDLAHIRGKVTRDWMLRWVEMPKAFRPQTRMPRVWRNSNTAKATTTMDYPLRDGVEIGAVVDYLLARSKPYEKPPAALPGTGDATHGKWVVENRGCKACHVVGAGDTGEGRARAHFGPELNGTGSKLTAEWVAAWVRDPKSMWPETRMPNLRLSDQEALDATAYLMTLKNETFTQRPVLDQSSAGARDMLEKVVYEYLRKETTTADAQDRLHKMDEAARRDYLGGKLIARYGCFGCHSGTPGYEDAQRIGTELTTWSSKLLTQLDFGFAETPRTKQAWLAQKLHDTRFFDQGKVESKDPQDLLKMPNFEFNDEQAATLSTAVLSFQRDLVQPEAHVRLTPEQVDVERGRRLTRASNCQGCHVLEDFGGGMEKVLEGGRPFSPPVLVASFKTPDGLDGRTEEGAKVQPDWLFAFLKGPTPIRPWLNVRMPTFGLSDAQATDVIRYFSAHAGKNVPYDSFDRATLPAELVSEGQRFLTNTTATGGFGCIKCHLPVDEAKKQGVALEELAPNLELAKRRLKYDWIADWLKDPSALQKDTRMPSFFYTYDADAKNYVELQPAAPHKIDALRAYLQFHGEAVPTAKVAAAEGKPRGARP